jgi:predicted kinase
MRFDEYILEEKELMLNEGIHDKGLFKAVFLMGSPGSGKSVTLSKIKGGDIEPRVVNVDKFTEFLDIRDTNRVYGRAKTLTTNQLALYVGAALPLFVDGTGHDVQRMKNRVRSLERLGYDVAYVFVNVSLETSLQRAAKRTRIVPPEVVEDYYNTIQRVKKDVKSLFSFGIDINNDEGQLTDEFILRAYRKISYFYSADVKNPIGQEYLHLMKENNWGYLNPNILTLEEIKSILGRWFSSQS